jgi:hypothetical protein
LYVCYGYFRFGVFDSFLIEVPENLSEEEIIKIMDSLVDFSDMFKDFKFRYKFAIGENWKIVSDKL